MWRRWADAQIHEQRLREQAGELRLHGLLSRWTELMGNAEQARWVAQLLGWEAAERHRRSLERRLRASELFAALGRLTGGVAHELGSPLGVIGSPPPSHDPGSTLTSSLPMIFFQNQPMFQPN